MIIDRFHRKFISYAIKHGLIKDQMKILIGFSGGADSTALCKVLLHFKKEYHLTLVAAHINYHLRGEDSKADERFVKEFCFENNIPIMIQQSDLTGVKGMENKAREIRMSFFQKIKKHYKVDKIALAHHKDDQSETVLSRFFRGSAFNGLSGIKAVSNDIIHPFLPFSRDEIEEYLTALNQTWREDLSNQESSYNRNKIRNQILPIIEKDFNPNFKEKLIDYAELFSEADKYFLVHAQRSYKKTLEFAEDHEIVFNFEEFVTLSPVIQFYIIKQAWETLSKNDKDFYYYHFKEIKKVLASDGGKEINLPLGIIFQKDYYNIRLFDPKNIETETTHQSREISSLRNIFMFNDKRILMQKIKSMPEEGFSKDNDQVVMDLDKIVFPLTVRYRQEGDRFMPYGMSQLKKLKDFFIDEKIAKFQRDKIAIICDAHHIIWVAGHRIDHRVAVDEHTKNFVCFKIEDTKENKMRSAKKKSKKG